MLAVAELILNNIFQQYLGDTEHDKHHRLACLNIILNLAADPLCPASLMLNQFIDHICYFYDSVETYGKDKETLEIGWIVGNFLTKPILNSHT